MSLKAWLSLAVLAAMIYLTIMLLPPYINNYQLQDDITTIARYSTYQQGKTAEDVRNEVLSKARDIGVKLTEDQVTVQKTQTEIKIDVNYQVNVKVPGYVFNLKFNPGYGNKMITAR